MAKKPAAPPPQPPPESFESAVAELERILAEMESDDVSLEQSLARYERGTFLLGWCRGVLGEAERKIEQLSAGPDDALVGRPMDVPRGDDA